MKKREILRENLFVEIGKLLALSQLKRNLPKAMREVEDDMSLKSTLESLQFHANELDRQLKNHCARYPNSSICKEKSKK